MIDGNHFLRMGRKLKRCEVAIFGKPDKRRESEPRFGSDC